MIHKGLFRSVAVCAAVALTSQASAASGVRHSSVYCKRFGPDQNRALNRFAYEVQPDGDLKFGLEIWSEFGNLRAQLGIARRQGAHWVYEHRMASKDPDDHCRLIFILKPDGSAIVRGDDAALCKNDGGVGTEIGVIEFPRSNRKGAVTTELRDAKTFLGSNPGSRC